MNKKFLVARQKFGGLTAYKTGIGSTMNPVVIPNLSAKFNQKVDKASNINSVIHLR
jgi:hypothetical protein